MKHQITIYAEHLPGKLNVVADYNSYHLSNCSDWKLNPETFLQLNVLQFGPFSIHLVCLTLEQASEPIFELEAKSAGIN